MAVSTVSISRRNRRDSAYVRKKKRHTEDENLPHYALPPWPEWSDAELNNERWDTQRSTVHKVRSELRSSSLAFLDHVRFEDPVGHIQLPPSLQPYIWIRLHSLPLMEMYHRRSTTATHLDLTTPNTHLLHSQVMRWIIAGIMNLYQLGRAHTVELEGQEEAFAIGTQEWKPWHHIYALCKVAKRATHIPCVNPFGKYIVRLFYMGCWRRITVDDYIPLDSQSRPLLPMSASGREMWPALLSKALLKVAALSWTREKEVLDFSVMACLTGWHAQELDLTKLPSRTIWCLCQKLLSSECDDPEDRFTGVKRISVNDTYGSLLHSRDSTDFSSTKIEFTDPLAEVIGPVVLCAVVQTPSPHIEHQVLITEAKVSSQGKDRPPTPLWKTFRWKAWALQQGIISIKDTCERNVKCIRMYSPLQKYQPDMEQADRITSIRDMSIQSEETKLTSLISPQVQTPEVQSPQVQSRQEQKPISRRKTRGSSIREGKGRSKERTDSRISDRSIPTQQQKEAKSSSHVNSIGKLTESKDHQKAKQSNFPEFWIKFEKLVHRMKRFEIYYRTKSFVYNLIVTDIYHISQAKQTTRKKHSDKEEVAGTSHTSQENQHTPRKRHSDNSKHDENVKISSSSTATSKNEWSKESLGYNVLYLLTDSMAAKNILLSFSVLKPSITLNKSHHSIHSASHQTLAPSITSEDSDGKETCQAIPPMYYIQGESYDWQSTKINEITFEIKTVATTCHLMRLQEGLIIFRLWMKLPEVYALRISSQSPFVLGTREMIQENLSGPSMSWKHYGSNFSHAFNTLIKTRKNFPNPEDLLEKFHTSYLPPQIPKLSPKSAASLQRKIFSMFEKTLIELLVEDTSDHDIITRVVSEWRWLFQTEEFGNITTITTKAGDVLEIHVNEHTSSPACSLHNTSELTSHKSDHLQDSVDTFELSSLAHHKKHLSFDQQAGILFLRRMFFGEPEILRYYPFRNDDKNHIHFTDYHGMAPKFGQNWIPLVRFVVNVHAKHNPYCAVYLTTTLPCSALQVIDNDTLTQRPRLLGDSEPSYFPHNKHGYTIFAFGYEDKHKDHYWKIRLLTFARHQLPHSCNWNTTSTCSPHDPRSLVIKEVKGHYIPNEENVIYKCLLTLKKSQILTLRTVMSNSDVQFVLKIALKDGDVITEYKGSGELIIPVLRLDGQEFRIEAQVLGKTWSLNSEEMDIIHNLKEKTLREQQMFTDDQQTFRRKTTRRRPKTIHQDTLQKERVVNVPSWSLMLVVDQNLSSTVLLEKDNRRTEEIQNMKLKWERDDPGRSQRSSRIRQEFLAQNGYSAYLRGFIHEQGIQYGEKTKYLLEHLSCRESESKLDRKKVIQDDLPSRESESKLDWNKDIEYDRHEENRKRIQKFQEEYAQIKNQFNMVKTNQIMRNRRNQNHLATTTLKSAMMRDEACTQLNNCVEMIKMYLEEKEDSSKRSGPSDKSTKSRNLKRKHKPK